MAGIQAVTGSTILAGVPVAVPMTVVHAVAVAAKAAKFAGKGSGGGGGRGEGGNIYWRVNIWVIVGER